MGSMMNHKHVCPVKVLCKIVAIVSILCCGGACSPVDDDQQESDAQEESTPTMSPLDKQLDRLVRMNYGLFVHYVFQYGKNGRPSWKVAIYPDHSPTKTIDEAANAFDAKRFARDVHEMGFHYVIFTAWHAGMNTLYPSQVMREWRDQTQKHYADRDLIGDLIDALDHYGIPLILYVHLNNGHDFSEADMYATGYRIPGKPLDKARIEGSRKQDYELERTYRDNDRWTRYNIAAITELGTRYGDRILGYWGDNLGIPSIYLEPLRAVDPDGIRLTNRDHTVEHSKVGSPGSARLQCIRPVGHWMVTDAWDSKQPEISPEEVVRQTVLQASQSVHGGVAWSMGCFAGREGPLWYKGAKELFVEANAMFQEFSEAIVNVYPSTSFPLNKHTAERLRDLDLANRPPTGDDVIVAKRYHNEDNSRFRLKNLRGGWCATQSADRRYTYIHVLNPPESDRVLLPEPADGVTFSHAINLRTREPLLMQKKDDGKIELTITGDWHPINHVIRLTRERSEDWVWGVGRRGTGVGGQHTD